MIFKDLERKKNYGIGTIFIIDGIKFIKTFALVDNNDRSRKYNSVRISGNLKGIPTFIKDSVTINNN